MQNEERSPAGNLAAFGAALRRGAKIVAAGEALSFTSLSIQTPGVLPKWDRGNGRGNNDPAVGNSDRREFASGVSWIFGMHKHRPTKFEADVLRDEFVIPKIV